MKTTNEFLEYILDMMPDDINIIIRKMFGGILLKVKERQLGVILNDILYFKVTDLKLQKNFKDNGSKQFTYIRKDKIKPVIIKNWWSIPESAMDNREEMEDMVYNILNQ